MKLLLQQLLTALVMLAMQWRKFTGRDEAAIAAKEKADAGDTSGINDLYANPDKRKL